MLPYYFFLTMPRFKERLKKLVKKFRTFAIRIINLLKSATRQVDQISNADLSKVLAQRAGVDRDHFIRTSEPDHRFAVQHFWVCLKRRDLWRS